MMGAPVVVKNGCISVSGASGKDFFPLFSIGKTMSRGPVQSPQYQADCDKWK